MSREVPVIRSVGAGVTYHPHGGSLPALHPVDLTVTRSDRIAVVGQSGSGKSTLLHVLAGLIRPTQGHVSWPAIGDPTSQAGAISVVFQAPSLVPTLTVVENVALPLLIDGMPAPQAQVRSMTALAALGLDQLAGQLPEELSGGQSQRVATARAIAVEAIAILADEPTGQLDHASAARVVEALLAAADHNGAALIIASHDPAVASRMHRQLRLVDGHLAEHSPRHPSRLR